MNEFFFFLMNQLLNYILLYRKNNYIWPVTFRSYFQNMFDSATE